MCIRHETREKARQSLAFSPVSKPHTHITYMLRQCTSIVYLFVVIASRKKRAFCIVCSTCLEIAVYKSIQMYSNS